MSVVLDFIRNGDVTHDAQPVDEAVSSHFIR